MQYIIGYSGGNWYCIRVVAGTTNVLTYPDGQTTGFIASGEDAVAGFWGTALGWLFVDIPGIDSITRYVSYNAGYTWTPVD